jgi:hypothetical protein
MRRLWTVLAALATLSLTNCGYNAIQTNDEQVKAGWSEVVNQYQRRADLVPNLVNSDTLFRDLMAQLEGTENRITVARNRYIKAVQEYNVGIRTFPNNMTAMMFGYKEKPNFTVENEKAISTAPKVDFNPTPAPAK